MSKGFQPNANKEYTLETLAVAVSKTVGEVKLMLDYLKIPVNKTLTEDHADRVKGLVADAGKTPIRKFLTELYSATPQANPSSQPQNQDFNSYSSIPSSDFYDTAASKHQEANAQAQAGLLADLNRTASLTAANAEMMRTTLTLHYMTNPDQITDPEALQMLNQARSMMSQGIRRMGEFNFALQLGMTGIPQFQALPSVQAAMQEFQSQHPDKLHLFQLPPAQQEQKPMLNPVAEVTE